MNSLVQNTKAEEAERLVTGKHPLLWSAIRPEEYELQNSIGEGTFGSVVKAVHRKTGTHVAIKLVDFV